MKIEIETVFVIVVVLWTLSFYFIFPVSHFVFLSVKLERESVLTSYDSCAPRRKITYVYMYVYVYFNVT